MSSISIQSTDASQISNQTIDSYNNLDFALARAEMESKYEDYQEYLLAMSSFQKTNLQEMANTLGSSNSQKVIDNALIIAKRQAIEFGLIIQNQLDSRIKTVELEAEFKIKALEQQAELKINQAELKINQAELKVKALEQEVEFKKQEAEFKIKIAKDEVEAQKNFSQEAIKRSGQKCNNTIKLIKEQGHKELLNMNGKFVNSIEEIYEFKKTVKKIFQASSKAIDITLFGEQLIGGIEDLILNAANCCNLNGEQQPSVQQKVLEITSQRNIKSMKKLQMKSENKEQSIQSEAKQKKQEMNE